MRPRHRGRHQQRSQNGARLIHRRMQTKSRSVSYDFSRFGKQDITGWSTQTLSRALRHHEKRCCLPATGERQARHDNQIQKISQCCDGPIRPCAIRQAPGKIAQTRGDHFAQSGDNSHLSGAGAKIPKQRTDDAVRAFVSHVGEQTDEAQRYNESKSGFTFVVRSFHHWLWLTIKPTWQRRSLQNRER